PDGSYYAQTGFAPESGTIRRATFGNCVQGQPCYEPAGRHDRHGHGWYTQGVTINGNFALQVFDHAGNFVQIVNTADFQDTINTEGFNNTSLVWTVNWGQEIGLAHNYSCSLDSSITCPTLTPSDVGVRSIVLPSQICDPNGPACTLQYVFAYNTDNGGGG